MFFGNNILRRRRERVGKVHLSRLLPGLGDNRHYRAVRRFPEAIRSVTSVCRKNAPERFLAHPTLYPARHSRLIRSGVCGFAVQPLPHAGMNHLPIGGV